MHTEDCEYLGNSAWNCGHIDNRDGDEPCDCGCCKDDALAQADIEEYPISGIDAD